MRELTNGCYLAVVKTWMPYAILLTVLCSFSLDLQTSKVHSDAKFLGLLGKVRSIKRVGYTINHPMKYQGKWTYDSSRTMSNLFEFDSTGKLTHDLTTYTLRHDELHTLIINRFTVGAITRTYDKDNRLNRTEYTRVKGNTKIVEAYDSNNVLKFVRTTIYKDKSLNFEERWMYFNEGEEERIYELKYFVNRKGQHDSCIQLSLPDSTLSVYKFESLAKDQYGNPTHVRSWQNDTPQFIRFNEFEYYE